jgi:hypothetical protein
MTWQHCLFFPYGLLGRGLRQEGAKNLAPPPVDFYKTSKLNKKRNVTSIDNRGR